MKSKYTFDQNKITATLKDGYYLWIAFLGASESCRLEKVSCFNPNTTYYFHEMTANEITNFRLEGAVYLYMSVDSSTNIGARATRNSYTTPVYFLKPAGITEKAVDITMDGYYVYFLTPGTASGENAKIVKFNKSTRAYVETINLTKSGLDVNNATKLDKDVSGNLWVVSESNPVVLTKVYSIASVWDFNSWTIS